MRPYDRPYKVLLLTCVVNSGGVRTLIALHHGLKTKSESFTSCRGRVNISGGSKIARINVECNGDSLPVAIPSKVKSVGRPARLLLFLRDKFDVRRQLKRFRKNRNFSLAQESIHLVAVTLVHGRFDTKSFRYKPFRYKLK